MSDSKTFNVQNRTVEIGEGSITRYNADVLVVPANPDLTLVARPGSVQYAFLVEGGTDIFEEVGRLGHALRKSPMDTQVPMAAPPTSAHLTTAGKLPAKRVLHSVAVGYDRSKGGIFCDAEILARSTRNALEKTAEEGHTSIGFPALGTGLYRVPLDEAVDAMLTEFESHFKSSTPIQRAGLVLFGDRAYGVGKDIADRKFGESQKNDIVVASSHGPNIQVVQGDITQISVDAIMTAINSGGMWFGGVDGAIQNLQAITIIHKH